MFKWVSWVIRMGATALLLSFLCIWTTGYIVNSYMESVIKQLDLPIDIQPIAMSGVWGTLWGADKEPIADVKANSPSSDASPTNEGSSEPQQSQVTADEDKETTGSNTDPDPDPDQRDPEATPNEETSAEPNGEANPSPSPGPGPDSGEEGDGSAPVFNGEAVMGQLTDAERQTLYAMVVSKLNQDQLKQLSDSLQGGLTSEELTELQDMLKSSLTEQEYSQMMGLLQGAGKADTDATLE